MRILKEQHRFILDQGKKSFGEQCQIWLFGSRANDNQKGVDIDLYIETNLTDDQLIPSKIQFLSLFCNQFGDQKVDIVLNQIYKQKEIPIYQIAKFH